MGLGLELTIGLVATIGIAWLAGRICHIGDIEKDPLDISTVNRLDTTFLPAAVDSDFRQKYY